jgi:hypothetical protein
MNYDELVSTLGVQVKVLEEVLDAKNQDDFKRQFQRIFSCPQARDERGVVYVWATMKPIPRLKSKSNIVYIGQTSNTLFTRHHRYASLEASGDHWRVYKHIIDNYGPISVRYAIHPSPEIAERDLLKRYLYEHLEMPPLNRRS